MTYTDKILEEFDEECCYNLYTGKGYEKAMYGKDQYSTKTFRQFLSEKLDQALAEERERVRGEIEKLDNYKMAKPWSGIVETFIVKSDLLSSLDKPLPDNK